MKNAITNIESADVSSVRLVGHNLSRVKMWASGFAASAPVSKCKGRAIPRAFVNTRDVVGRLEIALSTYATA